MSGRTVMTEEHTISFLPFPLLIIKRLPAYTIVHAVDDEDAET